MKVMSVRPIEPSTARKYVSWKWRAQSHTSPAVPSAKPPTNASLAQFVVFDEDRGNGGMNNTSPYEDLTRDGLDGFQPYPGVGMRGMHRGAMGDGARVLHRSSCITIQQGLPSPSESECPRYGFRTSWCRCKRWMTVPCPMTSAAKPRSLS
jgi:hypothetical protein